MCIILGFVFSLVLEKENLDLMLKSENLDVGAPKPSSSSTAGRTTSTSSKQEDYSFNDDNTFDDEGLLLGDNSLMEDVRAAVASEAEKENSGRSTRKKRRRKRGLTPAKSNVMIDNSNVSVKKQKLSNDVEETNNILAPTEPKRRTDQVRPAILSQPSVDDGDNPECTQQ